MKFQNKRVLMKDFKNNKKYRVLTINKIEGAIINIVILRL